MNSKLLLVRSITLLYRESQMIGKSENSSDLIREVVKSIRLPEINLGFDHAYEILDGLRNTVIDMCNMPVDHTYELSELLPRLKMNTVDDVQTYEALYDGIAPELTIGALTKTCMNIKRSLRTYLKDQKIDEVVQAAHHTLKFRRSEVSDMRLFVSDVIAKLEPFKIDGEEKDPAIIDDVDLSDFGKVTDIFNNIKDSEDGTSLLKTGYQAINRMLDGGFRRGEFVGVCALEHKYKSGFSFSLFKQIAMYNVPVMTDPKKKPLLLRISAEDSVLLNFQFLYQNLKENETGIVPDVKNMTEDEISAMAQYVHSNLTRNGYHIRIIKINPSLWTYVDICNKILELEAEGFEIHLCMMDYLFKISTAGCDNSATGVDLRNLCERVKAFMSSRNITFISPFQLSPDAKILHRNGATDFVKQLPGHGYYAGSKQIEQVIDLDLFIHIEEVNGISYLTVQRGKHRKITPTPSKELYCALPFRVGGGIMDDIGMADSARRKVGGGPIGSGEEVPFFDFNDQI